MLRITTTYVILNIVILKLGMMFCDKTILNELDGIMNPTLREIIDKSIVGKLIKAKVHFGLCHPVKNNSKIY